MSAAAVPRPIVTLVSSTGTEPGIGAPVAAERSSEPRVVDRRRIRALRIALGVSIAATLWVIAPYLGWLVLAAWFAALARPALERISDFCGGRRRAAALVTLALLVAVVAPIALVLGSLTIDAIGLVRTLGDAHSGDAALRDLVSGGAEPEGTPLVEMESVTGFLRSHSDQAAALAVSAAGSLVDALLGLMVLFGGAYTLLVHGPAMFKWLEGLAPASRANMIRVRDAFVETGRGLLIGSGLTGLTQAIMATIFYAVLGVPRPLVLGFLTLAASVIPGVGTALVWVPLTAGLLLTGRTTAGILLGVLCAIFVAGIDNVVRPYFVRWGKLQLSPFIVMVSVFGGLAALGPWGILFGPIVVRLGVEVLRIARDEHAI
ncbi:MAG: AI-2E family transporter [Sandaracinus sp.]